MIIKMRTHPLNNPLILREDGTGYSTKHKKEIAKAEAEAQ
jgi:hypothetical protein